jgi:hypothetical protein
MNQPFALFAKTLFEDQKYPDLTKYPDLWQGVVRPQEFPDTHLPPYDLSGWTLPYQMGVKVTAARTPLKADLAPVEKAEPLVEEITGEVKYAYLISTRANNSFTAVNRILREGGEVLRAADSFKVKGKDYPPGTFIIPSQGLPRNLMESLEKDLYLDMDGAGKRIDTKTYRITTPRVGLYKSWRASMDEGWTRWLLERFEFSYTNIFDAELRAGELNRRFDVIIIPSLSSNAIIEGHAPGTIPPQYVGGISQAGVRTIKRFVEQGGHLVTINAGCLFAVDNLGIPVKDALQDVRAPSRYGGGVTRPQPPKFSCPGSILRMEFDSGHPVAYGMPTEAPGVFYRSTAVTVLPSIKEEECRTVATYAGENLLMSGYLLGEKYLAGKAAAVDVPLGKGKVILLGFAVQNRAQSHVTFKLLFNSLYYAVYRP